MRGGRAVDPVGKKKGSTVVRCWLKKKEEKKVCFQIRGLSRTYLMIRVSGLAMSRKDLCVMYGVVRLFVSYMFRGGRVIVVET